jgi:hypothetical protein
MWEVSTGKKVVTGPGRGAKTNTRTRCRDTRQKADGCVPQANRWETFLSAKKQTALGLSTYRPAWDSTLSSGGRQRYMRHNTSSPQERLTTSCTIESKMLPLHHVYHSTILSRSNPTKSLYRIAEWMTRGQADKHTSPPHRRFGFLLPFLGLKSIPRAAS